MSIVVIVKYLNGKMRHGTTLHIGDEEEFQFTSDTGKIQRIPISLLKAVFFLKDAKNKGQVQPRYGKKIVVEFSDGEKILGTTNDYREDKSKFTIFPLDKESNNDRILVNAHAAKNIDFLGATFGMENKPTLDQNKPVSRAIVENAVYKVLYQLATDIHNSRNKVDEAYLLDKKIFVKNKLNDVIRQFEALRSREECIEIIVQKLKEVEMAVGDKDSETIYNLMETLFEKGCFLNKDN